MLDLRHTEVSGIGCATLATARDSGALPALEELKLEGTPSSLAARAAVTRA